MSPCFTQAGEYKPKGGILCHGWEMTGWEKAGWEMSGEKAPGGKPPDTVWPC